MRSDGSYVGRSAPEIDVFEATIDPDGGKVCYFFSHDFWTVLNESACRYLCQLNGLHIMSVLFLLIDSALNVCFRPGTYG